MTTAALRASVRSREGVTEAGRAGTVGDRDEGRGGSAILGSSPGHADRHRRCSKRQAEDEGSGHLAFVTGPNNASEVSSLMALGCLEHDHEHPAVACAPALQCGSPVRAAREPPSRRPE